MAYRTDNGGLAFKCTDIKLMSLSSTWGTRLSKLSLQTGAVRIITYSLPDMDYVVTQLGRRPRNIFIVAHSKFIGRAQQIKKRFPDIELALKDNVHSKVLLIQPSTIYISSANFGDRGWHESTIGLHSVEAHDWYLNSMFQPLWDTSTKLPSLER